MHSIYNDYRNYFISYCSLKYSLSYLSMAIVYLFSLLNLTVYFAFRRFASVFVSPVSTNNFDFRVYGIK